MKTISQKVLRELELFAKTFEEKCKSMSLQKDFTDTRYVTVLNQNIEHLYKSSLMLQKAHGPSSFKSLVMTFLKKGQSAFTVVDQSHAQQREQPQQPQQPHKHYLVDHGDQPKSRFWWLDEKD